MYYPYHGYGPYVNQYSNYPYRGQPQPQPQPQPFMPQQPAYPYYNPFSPAFPEAEGVMERQQSVRGQATWTEGGPVTECNIPWSANNYMTVAVGPSAPYQCGETITVKNLSSPDYKEISVKVVDEVPGYPANRINLHRRAFEALGARLETGVINVEINPSAATGPEHSKWDEYLSNVIERAFPNYNITGHYATGKTEISNTETEETFVFVLQSPQETRRMEATVSYNPSTERVISVKLNEV